MGYTHLLANDPSIEVFAGAFRKIRRALGTTAFGINEITMPAGFEGFEHDELETGHEEVYAVLGGSGTATVDGIEIALTVGDFLRVDADATRMISSGAEGLHFLVIGGKPRPEYDGRGSL